MWRRLRTLFEKPIFWVRVNGAASIVWMLLMVPSLLWWKQSILWVIVMSCYANVAGSVAGWQAARADSNSVSMDDLRRVEGKVDQLLGKAGILLARGRS